jgi:hypothetical protein
LSDIVQNPLEFCRDIKSLLTHELLLLGTIKPTSDLLASHNPTVHQEDLTLRDIVFIIKSLRSILFNLNHVGKMISPNIIGEILLEDLAN